MPLAALIVSPTNPRKECAKEPLDELAASIRRHGVLQAILARPRTDRAKHKNGAAFEIVAGERRWRAAKLAGLKSIPAFVRNITDAEALQIQIVENLQRRDVHPLDEAEGFRHLKEFTGFSLSEVAQKVGKEARYVARRLALTNLIAEAKTDFLSEALTLSHALELCRLAPEIQRDALAACYESKTVFDQSQKTWVRRPDREKPIRHVRHLQDWIKENVYLNLAKAAFKKDDARLREDGLTCLDCPHRSGFDSGLFHDIKHGDTCLNPSCFQSKLQTFVQIRRAEIEAKNGVPFIDALRRIRRGKRRRSARLPIDRQARRQMRTRRAGDLPDGGNGQS
ncbi:MAG: ParB/RepB/Spo0J family partition protein [Pyrinomonadaceae bacterium]